MYFVSFQFTVPLSFEVRVQKSGKTKGYFFCSVLLGLICHIYLIMTDASYAKSIELPTDHIFDNLKQAKRFAIDIGNTKHRQLANFFYFRS